MTILYTSPTAIRAFMAWGREWVDKHDLSQPAACSARVGEPINPAAWKWYSEVVGKNRCPDRRYVVANGNRLDSDLAAAGRDADETRLGDAPAAGNRARAS